MGAEHDGPSLTGSPPGPGIAGAVADAVAAQQDVSPGDDGAGGSGAGGSASVPAGSVTREDEFEAVLDHALGVMAKEVSVWCIV